ncbi:Hpt domain-containing protein [Maridesulfovibrio hydrothermalis]|uniref:Hpt domain protein n=1 Tax=Maridesulfovibrio hydrothermalis AM13 = DSM 14728 TaxID=1121451 RepID=L0RAX7_9BACT|nr:Hpt domain-containing protein [Maridesulfovibrio hydrothermalis]CCO23377.1 Hpt domain protein [Maridesulfovibrio hydrothermalis AM13 = DSM 14728]
MNEKIVIKVDEDLEDIMPRYLEIRKKELIELEQAVKSKDFDQIRMLGHKLKGTGSAYGFDELSILGTLIEDKACENDIEGIPEFASKVRRFLDNLEIEYVEMD